MKKILFGAGKYGRYALDEYGHENVAYFVDNNSNKIGEMIDEIEVISFDEFLKIYKNYQIIVSTKFYQRIEAQLHHYGINSYQIYSLCDVRDYPTDKLLFNPYEDNDSYLDMSDEAVRQRIEAIKSETVNYGNTVECFNRIEIETINRCTGVCSFCPVSKQRDPRDYHEMSWELFTKIIDELADIDYTGWISLFSNNEPFLDNTIIDKQRYARKKLPNANFHLYTNGMVMNLDKFIAIMPYLDEMVIDNYNQKLELTSYNREIYDYCLEHPELNKKVTIVLRKVNEVLSTRGGDAPNARNVSYPDVPCLLPFKQMVVRPDGKTSLCCNDALGRNTLADLTKETILEAWNNSRYQMVRKCLREGGRREWNHCVNCDTFMIGES